MMKVFTVKVSKAEILQDLVDRGVITIVNKVDGIPATKEEIAQLAMTGTGQ